MGYIRQHDRNLLILVYKILLADKYPTKDYNIIFDPRIRPIEELAYLPDILIYKYNNLVLWVEVGRLAHDKAVNVIDAVGNHRFMHIPYTHDIFSLDKELPRTFISCYSDLKTLEDANKGRVKDFIEYTLSMNDNSKQKAAKALGISFESLRYRLSKY